MPTTRTDCANKVADHLQLSPYYRELLITQDDPVEKLRIAQESTNANLLTAMRTQQQMGLIRALLNKHNLSEKELKEVLEIAVKPDADGGIGSFMRDGSLIRSPGLAFARQTVDAIGSKKERVIQHFIGVAEENGLTASSFSTIERAMKENPDAVIERLLALAEQKNFAPGKMASAELDTALWAWTQTMRYAHAYARGAGAPVFASIEGKAFLPLVVDKSRVTQMSVEEFGTFLKENDILPVAVDGKYIRNMSTEAEYIRELKRTLSLQPPTMGLPIDFANLTAAQYKKILAKFGRAPTGWELPQSMAVQFDRASSDIAVKTVVGYGDALKRQLVEMADGQAQVTAAVNATQFDNIPPSSQGIMRELQRTDPKLAEALRNPEGKEFMDAVDILQKKHGRLEGFNGFSRLAVGFALKNVGIKYGITDGVNAIYARSLTGAEDGLVDAMTVGIRGAVEAGVNLFGGGTRLEREQAKTLTLAGEEILRQWGVAHTRISTESEIIIGDKSQRMGEFFRKIFLRTRMEDGAIRSARTSVMLSLWSHGNKSWDEIMSATDQATVNFRNRILTGSVVSDPVIGRHLKHAASVSKNTGFSRELWDAMKDVRERQFATKDGLEWLAKENPRLHSELIGHIGYHTDFFARMPVGAQFETFAPITKRGKLGSALVNLFLPFFAFRTRAHRTSFAIKAQFEAMTDAQKKQFGYKMIAERVGTGMQVVAMQTMMGMAYEYAKGNEDIVREYEQFLRDMGNGNIKKALLSKPGQILMLGFVTSDILGFVADGIKIGVDANIDWKKDLPSAFAEDIMPFGITFAGLGNLAGTGAQQLGIAEGDANWEEAFRRNFVPTHYDFLTSWGASAYKGDLLDLERPYKGEGGIHEMFSSPRR